MDLRSILTPYTRIIQSAIKRETPVRTGNLKNSIRAEVGTNGIDVEALFYAKYVNYRTDFLHNKPTDKELEDIGTKIADELWEDLYNKQK